MVDSKITNALGGICCCLLTVFLILFVPNLLITFPITLGLNWQYCEPNQWCFAQNRVSGSVDTSRVFSNGVHEIGTNYRFVSYPRWTQRLEFRTNEDTSVFSMDGLEFFMDYDIFYQLDSDNLASIFADFNLAYEDILEQNMIASIKNTAPQFTTREFAMNRSLIQEAMVNNLNNDLMGNFVTIRPNGLSILRIIFPPQIREVFLDTAIQTLRNQQAELQREVDLVVADTEEIISGINANTTIITLTAEAQSQTIVNNAESQSSNIIQQGRAEGISSFVNTTGITDSNAIARLFNLYTTLDAQNANVISANQGVNLLVNA